MSLNDINFIDSHKRRKTMFLIISMVITAIVLSAGFAGILNDSGISDTTDITIEMDEETSSSFYPKILSDYSGTINKNATAVEQQIFTSAVDDVIGIPIGNKQDTKTSDGKYFSVISDVTERESSFNRHISFLSDTNGFTENSSTIRSIYADDEPIVSVGTALQGQTKFLYQTYAIRGGSYEFYHLWDTYADPDTFASYEESIDYINFHSAGAYPSYLTYINFTLRLQFADLSNPTSATPVSYTVSFYNYLTEDWDDFRVENTSLITTYANGLYQTDPIKINRGNANFPAYFDPTDRITMLMRVGLEYIGTPTGSVQEINMDQIEYIFKAEGYEIAVSPEDIDPNINQPWRKNPTMILECKTNATSALPDDVVQIDGIGIWKPIQFQKIPIGVFDVGLYMNTSIGRNEVLYDDDATPGMAIRLYSAQPIKLDIDSIIHIVYPEHNISIPTKWYINETSFGEVLWEFNITTSATENDVLLPLGTEFEFLSITTPMGDDALDVFTFTNNLLISDTVTNTLGHGTYQVIAKSPNYINYASISDSDYDPISETTYSSPVNHFAEISDFNDLLLEGNIGQMNVTFVTEAGGYIYFDETDSEVPNVGEEFFTGATTFIGASVGVVDCEWIWYNGLDFGYYRNQFAMRGFSTDPPFVKIFNPEDDERLNVDETLFVAVIASIPEDVVFSVDSTTDYDDMTKGYLSGFEGISSLLQDFTYYATVAVEDLDHDTFHTIRVAATDGVNDLSEQEEILIQIDKEVLVEIDEIEEAFDDEPTTVTYTIDEDVILMNIILDGNKIATLEEDQLDGDFTIPKLASGTYFLNLQVRDDVGNYYETSASFFVSQSNPSAWGTIVQWVSDFFKILGIFLLSIIGIGIVVKVRKRDRTEINDCPFGECEVKFN